MRLKSGKSKGFPLIVRPAHVCVAVGNFRNDESSETRRNHRANAIALKQGKKVSKHFEATVSERRSAEQPTSISHHLNVLCSSAFAALSRAEAGAPMKYYTEMAFKMLRSGATIRKNYIKFI